MDEKEFILEAASLLHDIGKVRQRYKIGKKHEEYSYDIIMELTKLPYRERIANIVRYHHTNENEIDKLEDKDIELLRYLKKADQLSAAHDRDDRDQDKELFKDKRLEKVFGLINKEGDNKTGSMNKSYFPLITLNDYLSDPMKYLKDYQMGIGYDRIDIQLRNELEKIRFEEDRRVFLDTILSVLERNLIFVPSAYYYSKGDISLYHHLKLTAAIALALYRDQVLEKGKLIILGGNLSGIQNYIFRHYISDVADDRATRRIKGRSFIVNIYTDSIISYFLKKLDLSWSSILYNKSDGFAILLNYDENVITNIEKMRRDIEKGLKDLGRELYDSIAYTEIDSDDLDPDNGKNFGILMDTLYNKINERKSKILSDEPKYIFSVETKNEDRSKVICDYCGNDYGDQEDGNYKCKMCKREEEFGRWISRKDPYLIQKFEMHGSEINKDSLSFNYGDDCIIYEINDSTGGTRIFINPHNDMEDLNGNFRIMLIGKSVPMDINNSKIKSINEMLCMDEQRKFRKCVNLSILKIDIDNMGLILTSLISRPTISVYSSLIYFTSLFFASIVENLANEKNMYIVYAGGDDLTIFGRDIEVIDFADNLHQYFDQYFAYDSITVSAGIGVFEARFPIRRGIEITESELRKSKGDNHYGLVKNSITINGLTMDWNDFHYLKDKSIKLIYNNIKNNRLGKNFPYFLMNVQQSSIVPKERLMIGKTYKVPDAYISYYIARNFKMEKEPSQGKIEEEAEKLIKDLLDKSFLKYIKFISFYSILKMRYEEIMGGKENV